MAAERLSLLIEQQVRGNSETARMEESLRRLIAIADDAAKRTGTAARTSAENTKRIADNTKQSIDSLRNALTNPLQAAGNALDDLYAKMGRGGVLLAGVGTAIGLAGTGLLAMGRHAATTAAETTKLAAQLNITVSQAERLKAMSALAGTSFETLEEGIERISESLSQPGSPTSQNTINALRSLGVAIEGAGKKQRDVGQIFYDSLRALSGVRDANERIRLSLAILGESGAISLQPLIVRYQELDKVAQRTGAGSTPELTQRLAEADKQLREMSVAWDQFRNRLTAKIAPIVIPVLVALTPQTKEAAAQDTKEYFEGLRRNEQAAGRSPFLSPDDIRNATSRFLRPGQKESSTVNKLLQFDAGAKDRRAADALEIRRLVEEKDDQSRLAAANAELQKAIEFGNVARVRAAQARIDGLQKSIEASAKEKAEREKHATFSLFNTNTIAPTPTRVPSLLSNRERILRGGAIGGDFTIDPTAYASANQGGARRGVPIETTRTLDLISEMFGFPLAQSATTGIEGDRLFAAREQERQETDAARRLAAEQQITDLTARRLELLAGPGGEVAAINQITALRLASLEKQKALGTDLHQIEMERTRIVQERELQILELKKKQKEEGRNAAQSLFDAAVGGGQGIRSFITSQALSIPRTVAGNLGAELGGLTGRFSLGLGGLPGRLLSGTPFGADPLKQAGDIQMTAAQLQLEAAQINSGQRSGTAGAGGTLGSILGGVTSNPLIFNARGGSSTPGVTVTDALGIKMPTLNTNGSVSGGRFSGLSRGVGIASVLAGGAFGAYSGFKAGGAQGALTGTSSLAGAAAGLLPLLGVSGPAAPILGAVALGLGAFSAILGNPKQKESARIDRMLDGSRFTETTGRAYVRDAAGGQIDYDRTGGMRVTYVYYQPQVNTIDQRGVSDFFNQNKYQLAKGMSDAITDGQGGDFLDTMRQNFRT